MNLKGTSRFLVLVLLGCALGCGVYAVFSDIQRSKAPYQLDYEEGNILNSAVRINHGLALYPDPLGWPSVINAYGPLPSYLIAAVVHFYGPGFTPSRVLIIAAVLLCALMTGLIVHHFSRSALLGSCFGLLLLSQWVVQSWTPVIRVDFIALLLVLLGLYVFARWPRIWFVAVFFFALAIFTKFNLMAAPAACFVWFLVRRQWKQAIMFAVSLAFLVGLLFGTALLVTHGAFGFDVFLTEMSPMLWSSLPVFYKVMLISNPVLVVLGLFAIAWSAWTKNFDLPVLYAIFTLIGTVSAAKVGSNFNHSLESIVALCIVCGWFLGKMVERGGAALLAASAAGAFLGIWMLVFLPYFLRGQPQPVCASFYRYVGQVQSDRILSEDVGLLVVNGKSVWVSDPFAVFVTSKRSSDTQLQQHIAQRWFDYIIVNEYPIQETSERWPAAVRKAIAENYVVVGKSPCRDAHFILAPAPAPATKQ